MKRRYYLFIAVLVLLGCMENKMIKPEEDHFEKQRSEMVEYQIKARGISAPDVLSAMLKVERHLFVTETSKRYAYADHPLPIGYGQTISQPYIVAFMTEAAKVDKEHKVLEIGTGSGYQAAVLGEIASSVFTIEIQETLCEEARKRLKDLGYDNITVICGDGYKGLPDEAPFDRIIVTAAPTKIPQPLLDQLKIGGILVIPVGAGLQEMILAEKTMDGIIQKEILSVRFVPLVDEKGRQY